MKSWKQIKRLKRIVAAVDRGELKSALLAASLRRAVVMTIKNIRNRRRCYRRWGKQG